MIAPIIRIFVVSLFLGLVACASPTAKLYTEAENLSLQVLQLSSERFVMTAFFRPGRKSENRLHVYLEGDGRPWQQGRWPASDPTTRSSLMLPLLAMDSAPVLYLGRPCYNGHTNDAGCDPKLWTSARYGVMIVEAMAEALQRFCRLHAYQQLVLIGHSGGGSLAMLLAKKLPQTTQLVTLAGNYDIDAWTDYHHYLPLDESSNPAKESPSGVPEWHFLAEQDSNVPPELFKSALLKRADSRVEVIPGIDHQQGWHKVWPMILKELGD